MTAITRRRLGGIAAASLALPAAAQPHGKPIQLWHIFNLETDMIHGGIRAWNEANPGQPIVARVLPFAQLTAELIKAIATGEVPDLVTINNPDTVGYAARGALEDITPLVDASASLKADRFYKDPWSTVVWRGRVHGIPRESNTLGLYVNLDMLGAAGLQPPATWSELQAAAEKLTDAQRGTFGLSYSAIQSEEGTFQFLPFLHQAGGSLRDLRSPQAVEALRYWGGFVARGHASRDTVTRRQYEAASSWMAGNAAMVISGPWELPRIEKDVRFKWSVHTLPVHDQRRVPASALGGFNWALPKGAPSREAAFRVIEFMASPERMQNAWPAGRLPPGPLRIERPLWPEAYATFAKQMESARALGPHPQWPEISRAVQTAIQESLTGTSTPEAALDKAARTIAPILARQPLENM